MYFQQLQDRLVSLARERVQAGELTERGLARVCGLSQPHVHNVLKNVRALSTESADRLLLALGLEIPDILWSFPVETGVNFRMIPVLRDRIGPGIDTNLTAMRGHIPMPQPLLKGLVNPIAARLGPDLVLPGALAAHDVVVLDQNPQARTAPGGNSCWVISEGAGLRIRYLRVDGASLFVADGMTLPEPQKWRSIALQGRNILDIVRARIVWMGREMEIESTGPDGASGRGN